MEETREKARRPKAADHYKHRCMYCSRLYNVYDDLFNHSLTKHHVRLTDQHVCWRCNTVCCSEQGLWKHIAFTHYGIGRRSCFGRKRLRRDADMEGIKAEPVMKVSKVESFPSVEREPCMIDLCENSDDLKKETTATCPICQTPLSAEEGLSHLNGHQKEVVQAYTHIQNFDAKLVLTKLIHETQALYP